MFLFSGSSISSTIFLCASCGSFTSTRGTPFVPRDRSARAVGKGQHHQEIVFAHERPFELLPFARVTVACCPAPPPRPKPPPPACPSPSVLQRLGIVVLRADAFQVAGDGMATGAEFRRTQPRRPSGRRPERYRSIPQDCFPEGCPARPSSPERCGLFGNRNSVGLRQIDGGLCFSRLAAISSPCLSLNVSVDRSRLGPFLPARRADRTRGTKRNPHRKATFRWQAHPV